MADWISTREAAAILGVSPATVIRSFATPEKANEAWGEGNWRVKPLSKRPIYQISRARAQELAE